MVPLLFHRLQSPFFILAPSVHAITGFIHGVVRSCTVNRIDRSMLLNVGVKGDKDKEVFHLKFCLALHIITMISEDFEVVAGIVV